MGRKKKLPVLESVAHDVAYADDVFSLVAAFGPSLVTIKSSSQEAFNAALETLGYKPVRLTTNLMNKLLMALAAVVLMTAPASAQRLPNSNSELGCKELNSVMENSMEKGEDFLDCNKQDDANYVHLKSPDACVRYLIMEYGSRFGVLNRGYPPLVPYRHILRGCNRLVLSITQDEYYDRCNSFCVPRPY